MEFHGAQLIWFQMFISMTTWDKRKKNSLYEILKAIGNVYSFFKVLACLNEPFLFSVSLQSLSVGCWFTLASMQDCKFKYCTFKYEDNTCLNKRCNPIFGNCEQNSNNLTKKIIFNFKVSNKPRRNLKGSLHLILKDVSWQAAKNTPISDVDGLELD